MDNLYFLVNPRTTLVTQDWKVFKHEAEEACGLAVKITDGSSEFGATFPGAAPARTAGQVR